MVAASFSRKLPKESSELKKSSEVVADTQVDLQLTHSTMWCVATAGWSQVAWIKRNLFLLIYSLIDSKPLRKSKYRQTMIGWTFSISILSCLNNTPMRKRKILNFFYSITHSELLLLPPSSERPIVTAAVNDRNARWRCWSPKQTARQTWKIRISSFK